MVKLINKKEFAKTVLDENSEIFVIYVAVLSTLLSHPSQKAQLGLLLANEASNEISSKYSDSTDIFLPDLTIEFSEYINMNNHIIELEEDKEPLYSLIYSLGPVNLEILQIYIET